MAKEKYFPFRSVSGDRKYSAEDWAAYFALFLSDGVFYSSADKLKVVEYSGMKVKVQNGAGFIGGRMYILETYKVLTLDTADGVLNRIDRIVLRCDYANRLISVEVVKGSPSEVPTAPELTRDADVYELALADVYVAAGVITITTANITDQRLNTPLCGIVTGLVEQADTTEIFNQFQGYLQEFMQASEAEYTEWLEGIKDILTEDAAGNLLAKIEDVEDDVAALQEEVKALPTGDTSTAGYNAETDSLWVLKDDEKVDVLKLYSERTYLVKDGLNYGNLSMTDNEDYGTITSGDNLLVLSATSSNHGINPVTFDFDEINLTNCDRIVFSQKTTFTSSSGESKIWFGVKDSLGNIIVSYKIDAYNNGTSFYDDVILDVNALSDNYTIFIILGAYNSTSTTQIAEVYAE